MIDIRKALENDKTPLYRYVSAFVFIVALRNFLELFSDHSILIVNEFLHYSLFYVSFVSSMILLIRLFTAEKYNIIVKAVLAGFIIVISPPILDLIISGGKGFDIGYVQVDTWKEVFYQFVSFWGGLGSKGATLGIKIEVLCVIFTVVWTGKRRYGFFVLKAVFAGLLVYTLFFLYSVAPSLLRYFAGFVLYKGNIGTSTLIEFFMLFSLIQLLFLWWRWRPEIFRTFFKSVPYFRILHYVFMPFIGIILARHSFNLLYPLSGDGLLRLLYLILAVIFSCLYALNVNNEWDTDIDKLVNPGRVTVIRAFGAENYRRMGLVFFVLAVMFSLMVSFESFVFVLLFNGVYYLYSSPPFRLKRIPVFSKLLIGLNTWILVLSGWVFAGADIHKFPFRYTVLFVFVYGLAVNFIDIKDYEGDKAVGIATLPVILGLEKSKFVIAILLFLAFAGAPFLLGYWHGIILTGPAGILAFILTFRKNYRDRTIMILYVLTITLGLVFYKFV